MILIVNEDYSALLLKEIDRPPFFNLDGKATVSNIPFNNRKQTAYYYCGQLYPVAIIINHNIDLIARELLRGKKTLTLPATILLMNMKSGVVGGVITALKSKIDSVEYRS